MSFLFLFIKGPDDLSPLPQIHYQNFQLRNGSKFVNASFVLSKDSLLTWVFEYLTTSEAWQTHRSSRSDYFMDPDEVGRR